MSRYVKFFSALFGGIATWGYTAASEGGIDASEWFGVLAVLGTALAVFQFPNTPPAGEPRDPDMSEQAGHYDPIGLGIFAVVLILVLVVLLKVLDHA